MGADSIPLDFGGQVFFPTSTDSNSSAAATGRCHLTGQGAHVSYVSEALGYVGTDTGTVHFRLAPLSKLNPPRKGQCVPLWPSIFLLEQPLATQLCCSPHALGVTGKVRLEHRIAMEFQAAERRRIVVRWPSQPV